MENSVEEDETGQRKYFSSLTGINALFPHSQAQFPGDFQDIIYFSCSTNPAPTCPSSRCTAKCGWSRTVGSKPTGSSTSWSFSWSRTSPASSQLVSNYSNFILPPNQKEFLDHGLNFCPCRRNFNKTEVVASVLYWQRNMLWREFWFRKKNERQLKDISEKEEEKSEEEDENNKLSSRLF